MGTWFVSANVFAARRNPVSIFSIIAGDGIGKPKCWVMNEATCPPTCRFGT
jgi:hypothetical protein